ncbi:MAG: hypothetical protein WCP93_00630 [Candidatus Berkelbacteria bacterium]
MNSLFQSLCVLNMMMLSFIVGVFITQQNDIKCLPSLPTIESWPWYWNVPDFYWFLAMGIFLLAGIIFRLAAINTQPKKLSDGPVK